MQLLMCFVLWLSFFTNIQCKISEKHKQNSLEQQGKKIELEILNPNRTFYVSQFEVFNFSVAVNSTNTETDNYSNVEV